jgi:integrase
MGRTEIVMATGKPIKFKNGLAKVGRVYHYCFKVKKEYHRGSTGCELLEDAKLVLAVKRKEAALLAAGIEPPRPVPTFGEMYGRWKRDHQELSKEHMKDMEGWISRHAQTLVKVPITGLTTEVIRGVLTDYKEQKTPSGRPRTDAGANTLLRKINAIVGYAIDCEEIPYRPYRVKKIPTQRKKKPTVPPKLLVPFLTQLGAFKPKVRGIKAVICLMIGLGLREAEARLARWEYIDWHQKSYTPGKTKTGDLRIVPIPAWLLEVLESMRGEQKTGSIFQRKNGKALARGCTRKALVYVCDKLSIKVTPHNLRATFATLHAEAGTPTKKIQAMLGHECQSTTEGYIQFVEDGMKEAQQKVAELTGIGSGEAVVSGLYTPPKSRRKI